MTALVTILLLLCVIGCAAWLIRDERREAQSARLDRILKASRHRTDRDL